MTNTITTYEERTFNMDVISNCTGSYVAIQKKNQSNYIKNNNYDYEEEQIRESIRALKRIDKSTRIKKTESWYFYNMGSVNIILNALKNTVHEIGYRNVGVNKPCYEVNFQAILDKTKPETF